MTNTFTVNDNTACEGANISCNNGNPNEEATEAFKKSKLCDFFLDRSLSDIDKDQSIFTLPLTDYISDDIDSSSTILHRYNRKVRTGNILGFLSYGDDELVIRSRFSNSEQSDYLLQYLLQIITCGTIVNNDVPTRTENVLQQLLIFSFPQYLESAFSKGVLRMYMNKEYNDSNVKGSIDIARHIRMNEPFTGNIAYKTREYTIINPVVELIHHTVKYIEKLPYGSKLLNHRDSSREAIRFIRQYSAEFNSSRETIVNWNKAHRYYHPYFQEYGKLQDLCIKILSKKGATHDISINRLKGVLFDASWLWEEYVNTLLSSDYYHPQNRSKYMQHHLFISNNKKEYAIYPDFLSKNVQNPIIIDAKYKNIDNEIQRNDRFQMLSYMLRFDSHTGVLVYPCTATQSYPETHSLLQGRISEAGGSDPFETDRHISEQYRIIRLGISIPQHCSSYTDFINKIHENENTFQQQLKNIKP